jgi:hypothetical protein
MIGLDLTLADYLIEKLKERQMTTKQKIIRNKVGLLELEYAREP